MSEEQTHLLHQEILKALRDANQAQNGFAKPEPARKPMTEEEIWSAYRTSEDRETFFDGVRFAEKHHGIGGGDE